MVRHQVLVLAFGGSNPSAPATFLTIMRDKLKKLIQGSSIFDEAEKKQLLDRLPDISEEDVKNVIALLEQEDKFNVERDFRSIKDFAEKSMAEIKKKSLDTTKMVEAQEKEDDERRADQLLDKIE